MTLFGGSQSCQSISECFYFAFLKEDIIYFRSHVKVRKSRLPSELLPVSTLPPPLRFYFFIKWVLFLNLFEFGTCCSVLEPMGKKNTL